MGTQYIKGEKANCSSNISGVSTIYSSTKKVWNAPHLTEIVTRDTEGKSVPNTEAGATFGPS